MNVRCKFSCDKKNATNDDHGEVILRPVTSDSPENKSFFKFTPGGSITLSFVNSAALAQFEEGKCYFVDFTEADAKTANAGIDAGVEGRKASQAQAKEDEEKTLAHSKGPGHHPR